MIWRIVHSRFESFIFYSEAQRKTIIVSDFLAIALPYDSHESRFKWFVN